MKDGNKTTKGGLSVRTAIKAGGFCMINRLCA